MLTYDGVLLLGRTKTVDVEISLSGLRDRFKNVEFKFDSEDEFAIGLKSDETCIIATAFSFGSEENKKEFVSYCKGYIDALIEKAKKQSAKEGK